LAPMAATVRPCNRQSGTPARCARAQPPREDKTMKNAKPVIVAMLIASLVVPTAYAKSKKAPLTPQPNATSQAGGLPATNARVAALEGAVVTLQGNLAAEIAARKAADAALVNLIEASQSTAFVAEGSALNIKAGTPVTVVSQTVPAGNYLIMAAVQMVNSQPLKDAKARCVMKANGVPLAETSDLLFPILTTAATPPSDAFGSTIFAPLQSSYQSSSSFTILVQCSDGNGDVAAGLDAFVNLAALKVAAVHVQPVN